MKYSVRQCVSVRVCESVCVYLCVCMYVCMYVCVYVCACLPSAVCVCVCCTFGSHPSCTLAVVISGFLCLGSSFVAGKTSGREKSEDEQ